MHLKTRNVNTALKEVLGWFNAPQLRGASPGYLGTMPPVSVSDSRNGKVLVIEEPVTVSYERPQERVLFNTVRDANPFFHLYEALWMLAGRQDVDPVAHYVNRMREFSDDGHTLNGAYGWRWRAARGEPQLMRNGVYRPGVDQLLLLAAHLKSLPDSRRAVLSMWNVEQDLTKIGGIGNRMKCKRCYGTGGIPTGDEYSFSDTCPECKGTANVDEPASKDVCCNLVAMFSLRTAPFNAPIGVPDNGIKVLDMTVINRSNDMLWGMLGANYVHFTFLQEYMAARLGVPVGTYHHVTNNLHVYSERFDWKPAELLDYYVAAHLDYDTKRKGQHHGRGSTQKWIERSVPLVKDPEKFDEEVRTVVEAFSGQESLKEFPGLYDQLTEPFLRDVAYPMLISYHHYKLLKGGGRDEGDVEDALNNVAADDWRLAAEHWMQKRRK